MVLGVPIFKHFRVNTVLRAPDMRGIEDNSKTIFLISP